MNYTKIILLMLGVLLLVAGISFADYRTIEGRMDINAFNEPVLQCWVTGSSAIDGFTWQVKYQNNPNWISVIDTAYNPYHWTSLRELKNEGRVKYWSTNSDVASFGYINAMLLNASNIEAWRCQYNGHSGDMLPVYFAMNGALPPVNEGDIRLTITDNGDNGLHCQAEGVVPQKYTWYKGTTDTKIKDGQDLSKAYVTPDTKYICEITYSDVVTKRVSYTTAPAKTIRAVDITCNDPVINNHLQTCAVHVLNEYDQNLVNAGVTMTINGQQVALAITNAEGNANLIFQTTNIGTINGTVRVYKEGYLDVFKNVSYTVLKEKYQIKAFEFSNSSEMIPVLDTFLRGDELYTSFKVWDPATNDYVKTPLRATVSLEGASKVYMTGSYDANKSAFVYHTTIPLTDSFLTSLQRTFVVAIAIDDATMVDGGAQDEKNVTILNNPPTIVAPAVVYGEEGKQILFNVNISDKEIYTSSELTITTSGMPTGSQFRAGVFSWTPQYTQNGTYIVTFQVTDRNGATAVFQTVIIVNDTPQNVTATITHPINNDEFEYLENVSFTVDVVNPDNLPVKYVWNFGDGATQTITNGSPNTVHNYNKVGAKTVTLTYTFLNTTLEAFVNINIKQPADCSIDITAPQSFARYFNGTDVIPFEATTQCLIPYTVSWDFGDNQTGSDIKTTHVYASAGQYTAIAKLTTEFGSTNDSVNVNVHDLSKCFEARNVKTHSDIATLISGVEQDTFYRGDAIFVSFQVVDTCNGDAPVVNAPVRDVYVQKQDMSGGFSNFDEFMYQNGTYYYKLNAIPLIYDVSKPDYVVAIALDNDNGLTRARKAIAILNSLPTVDILTPVNDQVFTTEDMINLTQTSSDREDNVLGKNLRITWTIDGNVVTSQQIAALAYSVGTHTVRCEAKDADNGIGFDQVTITIGQEANHAPIAVIESPANNAQFSSTEYFTVRGHGEDEDLNDTLTENWTIDGISIVEGVKFAGDYALGSHVINLTVTDNFGATGSAQVTININQSENHAPIAVIESPANNAVFSIADYFTMKGHGEDEDLNDTLTETWTIDGISAVEGVKFAGDYALGSHVINLTVTDNFGATGSAQVTFIVKTSINNTAPTVKIVNPTNAQVFGKDETITLVANATDKETPNQINLTWKIEGNTYDGNNVNVAASSLSIGQHTVSVTARDADGLSATDSVIISVLNGSRLVPPVAIATITTTAQSQNGTDMIFDASTSYDPDSLNATNKGIVSYNWVIDGNVYTSSTLNVHTQATNGKLPYQLTVVDDDGQYKTVTGEYAFNWVPPCDDECQKQLRDANIQLPIKFKQVRIANQVEAGTYLRVYISVFNEYTAKSGTLKDLSLKVSIPGIGVSKQTTFDIDPQQTKDFTMYLPISSSASGYFPIRVSVSNDEANREIYRSVTVN